MNDNQRVDVLIFGAGPAGLMAAAWMAQTGVKTLLVERRPCGTQNGRADGLESRTLEILDSFGLGDKIWAEANHTVDIALWSDSAHGVLQRESVMANSGPGWSRFYESTLSQGRVEEHLTKLVQQSSQVDVRRATVPTSLDIDYDMLHDHGTYPFRVELDNVAPTGLLKAGDSRPGSDPTTPNSESSNSQNSASYQLGDSGIFGMGTVVEAKYLLGCDGAHSWVRKQLEIPLEGENFEDHWGVLDIIPITDFPDIRKRCIIKSRFGTLMIIPRERRLVRVYVELSPRASAQFSAHEDLEIILNQVSEIMQPYTVKTEHIAWHTTYRVGQRLCSKIAIQNRIFLAGDAIHTHSPKAGQGMNVSIQDTYNLGWKLAAVVHGASPPDILYTYAQERYPIAERLIRLDQRICRGMCTTRNQVRGKFDEDQKQAIREENTSCSGLTATYGPNLLISQPEPAVDNHDLPRNPSLPGIIRLGARMPSMLVLNHSDSQAIHLQQAFPSTGRWNLVVFGGDISQREQMNRLHHLATALSAPDSYLHRLNQARAIVGGVGSVDVYLLHSANRNNIDLFSLPEIFRPFHADGGLDYSRVLVDNESCHHPGGGQLYQTFGIGERGCMTLLRPDQHVAFLSEMDNVHGLERFLRSFTCI
ncbi:FAD binding domain protein [Aspergillus avenaceus]|uniref:FAD binding domain protein n=1 Tax=Aspergillus avenaceus TaxID=36643 RepID=A0A5N6TQI8_ASPAV|nr:FAD binding domain protein [Aspergillus avenaceus]